MLTAGEVYVVGISARGRENPGKAMPSRFRLRTRDVHKLPHQTEFFKVLSQKLSMLSADLRKLLHVNDIDVNVLENIR